MKKIRIMFILALIFIGPAFAIVGDWVSYGSKLTLTDLHVSGDMLHSVSHGGPVLFDIESETFETEDNNHYPEHIDILTYYVAPDESEWFSYASGVSGISCQLQDGNNSYYDFDFNDARAFTGNGEHVLVVYKNDLTPEIGHFVKNNARYIFQDTYNQFPGNPGEINDITLMGDSIFLATDKGLIKSSLNSANLKPESAWTSVGLDSSQSVTVVYAYGDSLFLVNDDQDVYIYNEGNERKLLEGGYEPVRFTSYLGDIYYGTAGNVVNLSKGTIPYAATNTIRGCLLYNDDIWVSEEGLGLCRVPLHGGSTKRYMPNTMLYTKANSLAITSDHKVIVCGLEGISILDGNDWHNLVFSSKEESLNNEHSSGTFSADTLNIAYRVGGQTAVYDAMVTSENELICSITDITTYKYNDQPETAEGPGALQRIDLNDISQYTVYDTSNGVLDGTQGIGGGTSYYLMMRGVSEDTHGNIWALNVHTLAGETLLKFTPEGNIQRFSVEDSGGKLQILAREMIFDNYGHLWIANEARQADEPRTTGGITLYDQNTGVWDLITTADGLISNNVYSIDKDPLTGNMWVATASGVQMIRTPTSIGAGTDYSMNPAIDGLSGMVPVKLRIDPRGNKWILTQSQGIQIYMTNNRWFDDGNGLSADNSGLLDNVVYDLVFDGENGYAYLLTASGLNRFEIAWVDERTTMNDVIVFPQPFRPGVDPYLAIDGIADQSQVRIATLDGRVLIRFKTDADENLEKQVIWDGILPNGHYIPRGVYLAFITNIDGLRSTVKFAVE